jgi:cell division protein ZapA
MAQVTVIVNDKSYTLACDDGEEEHLTKLAAQIDNRIAELPQDAAKAGDAKLLLMAGLTLADDLMAAHERLAELEADLNGNAANARKTANGHAYDEEKVAGILESAARRMEDIAGRLASA